MDKEFVRELMSGFRVFPPWLELALGILIAIVGLALLLGILDAGYIHSVALFLPLLGFFAVANGALRQRRKVSLESQIRVVEEKGDALVEELATALRDNKPQLRVFHDLAISDARIQAYLLCLAEESNRTARTR